MRALMQSTIFSSRLSGKTKAQGLKPAGIKRTFDLPAVKDDGVVLRSVQDITSKGQEVGLSVTSTTNGKVTIALSRREAEVASVRRELKAGTPAEVTLTPPAGAGAGSAGGSGGAMGSDTGAVGSAGAGSAAGSDTGSAGSAAAPK